MRWYGLSLTYTHLAVTRSASGTSRIASALARSCISRTNGLAQCAECNANEREACPPRHVDDRLGPLVVLFLDAAMAPHDEHIGLVECRVAEPLLGIGKADGLDRDPGSVSR